MIEVDAGWIQLLDENMGVLSLATHRGFSQEMTREMKTVKLEESITGQVAQSGRPIVADAALLTTTENPWSSLGIDKRDSMYTFASVPIESRGQVLGVLSILSHRSHLMSTQQIQLLIAIGHQIGVAIENTRLIEETAEVEILQKLDRLRSELVANVSHELRTPLGLIKLCSSALLEKDVDFDPETQQQFLQSIDVEADRLEVIVNNLLNLSRLEGGQLRLVRRLTEIGQLVNGVIESMEIQFPQHHLVCDFPSESLIANVDSGYIEQVLRNLLTNAVKYSPDGGTITVQGQGDQWRVLISVSDQGIGIPPEDLERVFERFYRVENKATQDVSGAGLGLTVCQGIVEAHGGRIWVESTLGEGSTFYIILKRDVGDVNGNAQIANGYRGDEV
ncbi:MAG: ATP-binding protein [Anaerolineae bacterium]